MGAARNDRELAENGHVDVRVRASDVLPIWEVEPGVLQGTAQFEKSIRAAHFFQGEHIGFERQDALADLGLRLGGFGVAGRGGLIEVVLDVVGGDAEGFGGGPVRAAGKQKD